MFGWRRRFLFSETPPCLPRGVRPARSDGPARASLPVLLFCLALTFILAAGLRFLEIPFWNNPAYSLGHEPLLATHDAYHWIAGAEGFEFGAGHPMSEMVRLTAVIFGVSPAQAGFWMPPFLSGLLAVAIFFWGWGLGQPYAGMCAGILASLAPAFCARTLLGFYDTDLVVLLFSVLIGLLPALWLSPWLAGLPDIFTPRLVQNIIRRSAPEDERAPADTPGKADTGAQPGCPPFSPSSIALKRERPCLPLLFGKDSGKAGVFSFSREEMERSALSAPWLALLVLSGLFGWQTQFWHSMFPYLTRYCALLPGLLILLLGPAGGRTVLLRGAVCHSLPLLAGLPGALAAIIYAALLYWQRKRNTPLALSPAHSGILLALLWGLVAAVFLDGTILDLMLRSFASYADRSGHVASNAPDPVIFPSVARSIIEVQTISPAELTIYIHPVQLITALAVLAAIWRSLVTPAFLWLLPLLVLSVLSLRMGARMTMFGPPVYMLALCMVAGTLLDMLFYRLRTYLLDRYGQRAHSGVCPYDGIEKIAKRLLRSGPPLRFAMSMACTALLVWPLITPLPDYVQGPMISREQAEGLTFLKDHSPEDALVWNWWDWGYATHHFAHRHTIADGARHGGPSLYLPAAIYTTADPRFARQIIKYTALKNNVPGNVFNGLSASGAQDLMRDLGDGKQPLIEAPGKQYLVVSLDLLRLGLWVTRFGSWNFISREGPGALLNPLTSALTFNPDTGEIMSNDARPVLAAGIAFFESGGLEQYRYNRPGGYYFLFNIQKDTRPRQAGKDPIHDFWIRQRGGNPFPATISDKLAMDQVFFNTMMVQLLICPENDPSIAPYFRLIFDNTYTRVYEVL